MDGTLSGDYSQNPNSKASSRLFSASSGINAHSPLKNTRVSMRSQSPIMERDLFYLTKILRKEYLVGMIATTNKMMYAGWGLLDLVFFACVIARAKRICSSGLS